MQPTPPQVVSLENVSFSYDVQPVLLDVSLVVEDRDYLCVVGPNGGGKTTLLKLMLGLLKPAGGRVRVFGQAPEGVRSRIGYVPQHTTLDPLFPVTALDVVLMGRLSRGMRLGPFRKADREAAEAALEMVGMVPLQGRPFSALSGGQRQRVLIARGLVSNPELFLLDEPTSNVDAAMETELFEILEQLNRKMSIVLVTHDLGFVSRYVKRVACVNRRLVVHPTSEVTGEMIQEIYGRDVHMVRHDEVSPGKGGHV